jgi:hypothetical protein
MATAFVTKWDEASNSTAQEYVQFSRVEQTDILECCDMAVAAACKAFKLKNFSVLHVQALSADTAVVMGRVTKGFVVLCFRGHF